MAVSASLMVALLVTGGLSVWLLAHAMADCLRSRPKQIPSKEFANLFEKI